MSTRGRRRYSESSRPPSSSLTHIPNIRRLMQGTEPKIGEGGERRERTPTAKSDMTETGIPDRAEIEAALRGHGADYVEMRFDDTSTNRIVYRGRELEEIGRTRSFGGNARALVRGGWGFVSFNEPCGSARAGGGGGDRRRATSAARRAPWRTSSRWWIVCPCR